MILKNNTDILFFLGDATGSGGIERVSIQLANSLFKKGFHTKILSLFKGKDLPTYTFDGFETLYLNETNEKNMYHRKSNFILSSLFDIFYIIKKIKKVRRLIKKSGDCIIISSDIKMTLLIKLASINLNVNIKAIEHFDHDTGNIVLKAIRKILYNMINDVVLLTGEDLKKYNWCKTRITVIPNILSIPTTKKSDLTSKKILSVGRLTHQKGFDMLLECWKIVSPKYSEWCLEIVGDGEDYTKLNKYIVDNELQNINIVPFTLDIHKKYLSSSIFVLSSRYEGLGMVLLEAISCSMACISFACPSGPKTIIKNNYNGLLIKKNNIADLSKGLEDLISSLDLRKQLSGNCVKSISIYEEENIINQWRELLKYEI